MASILNGLLRRRAQRDATPRAVQKADAQWRTDLSAEQYRVLRKKGTERAFSGAEVQPGDDGTYQCGGCSAALFPADTKFDSGTGWPSFSDAIGENVEVHRDFSLGIPRVGVLCRSCGGHLGHVFNDGPAPTGKRYCINACALVTKPDVE